MSEKGGKKNTIENNKKATKDKKPFTLKFNDGTIVSANIKAKKATVFLE